MIREFKYPVMKSLPKVRMRDLSIKNSKKNALKKKFEKVISHEQLILGKEVENLEKKKLKGSILIL